jgi:WD40 repeat protein
MAIVYLTGSTLRVWAYDGAALTLRATLCGHDGSHIKCIDVSTECGVIVSGCGQGRVLLWDLRTLTFVRPIRHAKFDGQAVVSVSINHRNGNVVALVGMLLCVFDINGNLLAQQEFDPARTSNNTTPTCAISTDCPEWMEEGVVAVTGHASGEVRLWSLHADAHQLTLRPTVEGNPHSSPITVLRVTGVDRQDTLLIGDTTGRVSICKTVYLDSYSQDDLAMIVSELTKTTSESKA